MRKKRVFSKIETDLYAYKLLKTKIKLLELEMTRVKSEYMGIRGRGETIPSGGISKSVENEVIQKENRIEEIQEEIRQLSHRVEKIEVAMETLNDVERRIVEERYFNEQQWYDIAFIMGYTYKTIKNYHDKILDKLHIIYT